MMSGRPDPTDDSSADRAAEDAFAGAVVELHEYELIQDPESDEPRHLFRFEVHGRAADQRPLTAVDARTPLTADLLEVEDEAHDEGIDAFVEQLRAAFPGAEVGFCPNGDDSWIPEIETAEPADLTTIMVVDRFTGWPVAGT